MQTERFFWRRNTFKNPWLLVPLNAADLPFAMVLAEATIAASEENPSEEKRELAFSVLNLLAAMPADSKAYAGLQIRMAGTIVLRGNQAESDRLLDFCVRSLSTAQSLLLDVREEQEVYRLRGRLLADRCISRMRSRKIDDAVKDFEMAILLSPQIISSLGPRFKTASNSVSEQLPAGLRDAIDRDVGFEGWVRSSDLSSDLIRVWRDDGIPVYRLHPLDSSTDMYMDTFALGRRVSHLLSRFWPGLGISVATQAQVALPDDIPAHCIESFRSLERLPSPEFPFGVVMGDKTIDLLPQETGGIACERERILIRRRCSGEPSNEDVCQLKELIKYTWLHALHFNDVPVNDEALSVISQLIELRSLKLHIDPKFVTTAGLQQLQKLVHLNSLGIVIQGGDMGRVDFRQLAGIRSLRSLGICNRGTIPLEEMTQLISACDQIENLSITAECGDRQPRGLDGIGTLTKLRTLDLCFIGPAEVFFYDRPIKISEVGCTEVARLRRLESLSLCLTQLPDASLRSLADNRELRHLRIRGGGSTETTLDAVSKIRTLERFSCDDWYLSGSNPKGPRMNSEMTEFERRPNAGTAAAFAANPKPRSVFWIRGGDDNDFLKKLSKSNSVDSLTIQKPLTFWSTAAVPEIRFTVSDISTLKSLSMFFPPFGDRAAAMDEIVQLTQLQCL